MVADMIHTPAQVDPLPSRQRLWKRHGAEAYGDQAFLLIAQSGGDLARDEGRLFALAAPAQNEYLADGLVNVALPIVAWLQRADIHEHGVVRGGAEHTGKRLDQMLVMTAVRNKDLVFLAWQHRRHDSESPASAMVGRCGWRYTNRARPAR